MRTSDCVALCPAWDLAGISGLIEISEFCTLESGSYLIRARLFGARFLVQIEK